VSHGPFDRNALFRIMGTAPDDGAAASGSGIFRRAAVQA